MYAIQTCIQSIIILALTGAHLCCTSESCCEDCCVHQTHMQPGKPGSRSLTKHITSIQKQDTHFLNEKFSSVILFQWLLMTHVNLYRPYHHNREISPSWTDWGTWGWTCRPLLFLPLLCTTTVLTLHAATRHTNLEPPTHCVWWIKLPVNNHHHCALSVGRVFVKRLPAWCRFADHRFGFGAVPSESQLLEFANFPRFSPKSTLIGTLHLLTHVYVQSTLYYLWPASECTYISW